MYGKEILIEEEKFLDTVHELIELYKKGPDKNRITIPTLTKECVISMIKRLGKVNWIDEELIQDQINKL